MEMTILLMSSLSIFPKSKKKKMAGGRRRSRVGAGAVVATHSAAHPHAAVARPRAATSASLSSSILAAFCPCPRNGSRHGGQGRGGGPDCGGDGAEGRGAAAAQTAAAAKQRAGVRRRLGARQRRGGHAAPRALGWWRRRPDLRSLPRRHRAQGWQRRPCASASPLGMVGSSVGEEKEGRPICQQTHGYKGTTIFFYLS